MPSKITENINIFALTSEQKLITPISLVCLFFTVDFVALYCLCELVAIVISVTSYSKFFYEIAVCNKEAISVLLFALFTRNSFSHTYSLRRKAAMRLDDDSLTDGTSALLSFKTTLPVSPASRTAQHVFAQFI